MVFEGLSKCPLCGNVLDRFKEFLMVPHIVGNAKDSLSIFTDGGVHADCLDKSPLKEKLLFHIEKYLLMLPPIEVRCDIDGKVIDNPENMLFFNLLTSDEEEELFKFNYITLNKANLERWQQRENFIAVAEKFLSDGKWVGFSLEYILRKIKD